jgi:hypothetical protein
MYTAERQLALPYLKNIAGPLIEQWFLLHHRIVRVITNHASFANDVRSFLYYAELLAERTYASPAQLPAAIPVDLLWQAGERLYRPVALTCYLLASRPGDPFPPSSLETKPAAAEWDSISGVEGPLRARWKNGDLCFREYQAFPGVTSRILSLVHPQDLYSTIFIEQSEQCASWFVMRFVFYMALGAMFGYDGYEIVHAAAIAYDGAGVLIVGSPGSGKSTLVLSCLRLGMQLLADDVLFLAKDDNQVYAYAFPEDIGVRQGSLALLEGHDCMQRLAQDERSKLYVDVQQFFRRQVISSVPVRVLLFVHAQDRGDEFRALPLTSAQAVSWLLQEYISRERAQESNVEAIFQLFNDIALQVPAYRLYLTPDVGENARQVHSLLVQHSY